MMTYIKNLFITKKQSSIFKDELNIFKTFQQNRIDTIYPKIAKKTYKYIKRNAQTGINKIPLNKETFRRQLKLQKFIKIEDNDIIFQILIKDLKTQFKITKSQESLLWYVIHL